MVIVEKYHFTNITHLEFFNYCRVSYLLWGEKKKKKVEVKQTANLANLLKMWSTSKRMLFPLPVVHNFGTLFCWWQLKTTEKCWGKSMIFKMIDDFFSTWKSSIKLKKKKKKHSKTHQRFVFLSLSRIKEHFSRNQFHLIWFWHQKGLRPLRSSSRRCYGRGKFFLSTESHNCSTISPPSCPPKQHQGGVQTLESSQHGLFLEWFWPDFMQF